MTADQDTGLQGPVLFAYDGSDLAALAIAEAGRQLAAGRDALVLTVWQPFDVGFVPGSEIQLDASQIADVKRAAQDTASRGVALAEAAGFRARARELQAAPTWKGVVDVAEEHDASLIVFGSHGRTGLPGLMLGSVAGAVASHTRRPVLIVHQHA